MLDLIGVSHVHARGTRAPDHRSLSIPQSLYGPPGPNGGGRSTLMGTVATLQTLARSTLALFRRAA